MAKHDISITEYENKFRKQILEQIEEANKKHKCDLCDKEYSNKHNLRRHKRRLHGISLASQSNDFSVGSYECDICEAKFTFAWNLKKHKSTHEITNQETGASKIKTKKKGSEWYKRLTQFLRKIQHFSHSRSKFHKKIYMLKTTFKIIFFPSMAGEKKVKKNYEKCPLSISNRS